MMHSYLIKWLSMRSYFGRLALGLWDHLTLRGIDSGGPKLCSAGSIAMSSSSGSSSMNYQKDNFSPFLDDNQTAF